MRGGYRLHRVGAQVYVVNRDGHGVAGPFDTDAAAFAYIADVMDRQAVLR